MEVAEAAATKSEKCKNRKPKKIVKERKRSCNKKESLSPSLTRRNIKERGSRALYEKNKDRTKIRTRRDRERGRTNSYVKHYGG